MIRKVGFALLFLSLLPATSEAEVYCRAGGLPRGCVVRPAAVAADDAGVPGVGAPGVGVVPGVGAGAAGVGVAHGPGAGMNRGGPANRAGAR